MKENSTTILCDDLKQQQTLHVRTQRTDETREEKRSGGSRNEDRRVFNTNLATSFFRDSACL
jgi:hypothetical protein